MNTNLFYGTRTRTKYKPLQDFVEETEIIATRYIPDRNASEGEYEEDSPDDPSDIDDLNDLNMIVIVINKL